MDQRHLAHVAADSDFYDDEWQVAHGSPDLLGPATVPEGVEVRDHGPWRIYRSADELPRSGWKVHVSCVPVRAEHVVGLAVGAALADGLTCKHLRTRRLVSSTQAKYAEPTGSGKVVTIYPTDVASLDRIVSHLTAVLAGEPGARVLSDVPVCGAPVSVRFGAFVGVHHVDDRGRYTVGQATGNGSDAAIDDRSPHSAARSAGSVPPVVAALQVAAARRDAKAVLPVRDVRVLHRSNAGGVYAATWEDGRQVVLKEARRHTGFDLSGSDAVTRLRHEMRALNRLTGTGVVPEVVAYHEAGDSEFLVMEHVDGPVLTATMATSHPGAVPGADAAPYRQWVERVVGATRASLEVLHARGVTHCDVHPGNAIERDGGVVLIDLESSAVDGVAVAKGVATVLSTCGEEVTPEADLAALERMRALLVNPQYSLTARRPDLAGELLAAGRLDLGEAPGVALEAAPRSGPDRARLVAGITVSASPARRDRLFPSDVAGFGVPGGGLGLIHGAGGVLATLAAEGHAVPETWRAWLVEHGVGAPYLTPGIADGAEGVALCLARIGELDAARTVIERWGGRPGTLPWWARGTAGRAAAHCELARLLGDPSLTATALTLSTDALEAVERAVPPPGHCGGLLDGWAGVGLALLRVAEHLEAGFGHPEGATASRLRAGAHRALELESAAVKVRGGAWMTTDGHRVMPYLGVGSAALGLLAVALGGRAGRAGHAAVPSVRSGPVVTAASTDPARLCAVVDGVIGALRLSAVASSGLLHGRAGIVLALGCLAPDDPAVRLHQHRIGWHTLPVTTTSRRAHPLASDADLVLGDQNLRAAADLGTGAAGVLLALDTDIRQASSRALELLALPRSAAGCDTHAEGMTTVTTSR